MVDHDVRPGVENDMGGGDAWPAIREKVLAAEILVIASPTWLGRPSSVAQRVLEAPRDLRDRGRADRRRLHDPGAGLDVLEPRPGARDSYLDSDAGKDWPHETGRAAASNLLAVARALQERPPG